MIAGPNGAGKTTVALELISNQTVFYEFINADEIARGLAPLHPESMALGASKLMLKRLKELLEANRSFAFETTSGGHNIPQESIRRRYYAGIKNLLIHYLPLADSALIMDNSYEASEKKLIARKNLNDNLEIVDETIWERLKQVAHE
jgi:predicted ABC-type ATPase